ncbi:ammonium transporter [Nakamurella endophytica]|uniref:Ammonium transporter n=1 Tax=Nakamurella endophytica TaxID=1748367 RepID=A0A917SMT8_9ACTN|nr:ammonium transporter [Nakamurella endophytica]GGL90338.1 ammonium transporter [Nakamurella endophytica]
MVPHLAVTSLLPAAADPVAVNAGDAAWILASSALVLLMTPGLAFFYGGLTRAKSTLNMMMMSFFTIFIVTVLWALFGFNMAFASSGGSGFVGDFSFKGLSQAALANVEFFGTGDGIPVIVFAAFQLMFAIITPALISGAIADRTKFLSWSIFVTLWVIVVYFPVAHWVFDFGLLGGTKGWLAGLGVEDFAGGTAVHINAGAAGLALCIVLGRRIGFRRNPMRPHNVTLVLLGAGLLWFGWFGFNAGSALAANGLAGLAFMNTQVATASALGGWLLVEKLRDGKPTSVGAASGAVAGLVAITPACAFITPGASIVLGVLVGAICAMAVGLKYKLGYDDSLDVVGVHLVGGIVGTLFVGLFSTTSVNSLAVDGLFYGGGLTLLGKQALGAVAVLAYSFVVAFILGTIIEKTIGFRVSEDAEVEGIDVNEHAESAYEFDMQSSSGAIPSGHLATATSQEVHA